MRLNLNLRGVDLIDVEFHAGSKGVYLDVNWFQPRDGQDDDPAEHMSDRSGTAGIITERVDGPVWLEDQPVLVRGGFGFQRGN